MGFFKKFRKKKKSGADAMVQLPDEPEPDVRVTTTSPDELPGLDSTLGKFELLDLRRQNTPDPGHLDLAVDDALDGRETAAMVDRLSAATKFAIAREKVRDK